MPLSEALIKKLALPHPPSQMVDLTFRGKDLTVKTDEAGRAILLFIGRRAPDGAIKGERYARRLVQDKNGALIKDHWELKGKSV